MPPSRLTLLFPAITFALLGAFLSGVLLMEHLAVERGDCEAGCNELFRSRWATFPPRPSEGAPTVGAPVPLVGLLYFLGLGLWLASVGRLSWSQRLWHSLPMGVALVGGTASMALLAGLGYLQAWCPLCLAVNAVNLVLAMYVVLLKPERTADDLDDAPASLQPVLMGLTLATCAIVAAWFGFENIQQRQRNRELASALELAAARGSPTTDEPRPVSSSTATPPVAPAAAYEAISFWLVETAVERADTIVVFTDMLNPDCRAFEQRLLAEIVPLFAGRVRVALLHFPECTACNPGIAERSPWSCEAAYLAEAARQQAGAKGFLNLARALPADRKAAWTDEEVISLAIEAGLNPLRFLEDWQSAAVQQRVAGDIAQARRLGVTSVPTVFVNGQPIDSQVRERPEFWARLALRNRSADTTATAQKAAAASPAQTPANPSKPEPSPASDPAPSLPASTTVAAETAPAAAAAAVRSPNDSTSDPTSTETPSAPADAATGAAKSPPASPVREELSKPPSSELPPAPSPSIGPSSSASGVARPSASGVRTTTGSTPAVHESSVRASAASSSFAATPAPVLAEGLIKRYDANGDGVLQPAEYERIPGQFAKYDTSGDGNVDAGELETAIGAVQRFKRLPPQLVPVRTPSSAP